MTRVIEEVQDLLYRFSVWYDRKIVMGLFNRDYSLAALVEMLVFVAVLAGLAAFAVWFLHFA